jgi:hypothetical protein
VRRPVDEKGETGTDEVGGGIKPGGLAAERIFAARGFPDEQGSSRGSQGEAPNDGLRPSYRKLVPARELVSAALFGHFGRGCARFSGSDVELISVGTE